MATTSPKFWLSTSRIPILNVVTLLILNASFCVADETSSTCVWCGPLADQVQHSEIAPSCLTLNTTIACSPGYSYCATSATYPYLVESRYCSRVHRDECFLQYCNSSKTWKMTCTCLGNVCNGEKTERETEAFTKLHELVEAQQSRPKRSTNTDKSNFVLSDKDKTEIVTNISAAHSGSSDNKNDKHDTQLNIPEQPNMTVPAILKDEHMNGSLLTSNENTEFNTNNTNDTDKSDEVDNDHQNLTSSSSAKDLMLRTMAVEVTKTTSITGVSAVTSTPKPSEKLPTAEALQQVASSEDDDNNTEHTTPDYEPTESHTTDDDEHVTTATDVPDENTAQQNTITTFLLINSLLLQYIYNRK